MSEELEVEIKELRRPDTSYEQFMREENIPIYRGVGVHDVRELTLGSWQRTGGRGCFIQLEGIEAGGTGFYVVEIPAGGTLKPERHIYEELYYVVEGRGTTEVWKEGSSKKQVFEWQAGTLFAIPVNAWHRLVNATSSPALIVAATNAPPVMNIFHNADFIFNNPYDFSDRYDGRDDYFKPRPEPEISPWTRRAVMESNIIPDIVNCELPLDNQRGPGYRYFSLEMAENTLVGHIGEFPSGRYSKAHAHGPGAVLICLKGKGYSITWPMAAGTRPWEEGKGHVVRRQDYVPGGMVSAALAGENWFHQHFGIAKEPLRVLAVRYGSTKWSVARGDEEGGRMLNFDIRKGGRAIEYRDEDPYIRKMYEEALKREGVTFQMPEAVYR